jgi:3-oxoacyl-[acyl-carrier protein] reductase
MCIYIFSSLTASKDAGVTIEIEGKKVALGVPGAQRPVTTTQAPEDYPFIPLRRGGTPEDAAASVLLYVSFFLITHSQWEKNVADSNIYSLASPLASYVSGHTLEVTGGAGI